MIFILNFIFTIVFYTTRWTKQDLTCICFKEFLNQLNLFYISICLYLQYILNSVFTIVLFVKRWIEQDLICICFKEFLN
jgi:hypothetical protein